MDDKLLHPSILVRYVVRYNRSVHEHECKL